MDLRYKHLVFLCSTGIISYIAAFAIKNTRNSSSDDVVIGFLAGYGQTKKALTSLDDIWLQNEVEDLNWDTICELNIEFDVAFVRYGGLASKRPISINDSFPFFVKVHIIFHSFNSHEAFGVSSASFWLEVSDARILQGIDYVVLGALPLAVEAVNRNPHLLPDRKLRYKAFDIGRHAGIYRASPIRFMTEMKDDEVLAFIGPDEGCTPEALVAAAWNMPMISYKCSDSIVSNKTIFHSFARTLAPASKVSKSVIALLIAFNWQKFSIISGTRPERGSDVARAIKDLAEQHNLTVTNFREISDYIPMNSTLRDMQKIVDETFQTTRIYVFVGEHIAMVDFVRCLQNRKLLETGDYIVISVDDEIYDPTRRFNILGREYLDPYIKKLPNRALDVQSFRSVLKISMSHPFNSDFRDMSEKIKECSRKAPFLVPYHEKVFNNLPVPIYAAHLYDAVIIYAQAITELLEIGGDIRDGRLVMSRIFNRSYHSIQGFDVFIDLNGDAEGNYTVISLQADNLRRSSNLLKLSMQPVGYFVYNKESTLPEFRYIKADKSIRWHKGRPPLSEPICGFFGELCKTKRLDWRYFAVGSFITLLLLVAGAFLVKHYRYEQTLACLLWKVDMKEVTLISIENADFSSRNKSLFQTCRHSLLTGGDTTKRAFTTIGLYRGNIVAVKKIYKKSVDITRTIRKELKQMREVRHENIINFIGASVDHGAVAILTTYCARGSLEDVLANEDLHLDHMFISSLVSDIIKGLIYLHDSDIISHGNLRSSNCLVDSRWVCLITDFGLQEFKAGQEEPNRHDMEIKRALWTAPELLRNPSPPARGSQKGDVYSFGIVLYEIIGRKGPWGETSYSNEEIVNRVRNPNFTNNRIFRPSINHLFMPEYVKLCLRSCWEEDPEIRPDIRLVRIKLKEMQAGLKPNIFDNMLAIMEKYAYNLEGLVQERTNQLYEEKKKTDILLHRMLPKTVAESLKRGEPVVAECFDCVTIFFSDLVGFTELCANSTPFEVVEMLNDLYTCCDSIISNYDVYKVETIGDAYMVVSGLPVRNGDRHAGEIASLAIHILEKVSKLEIRHRPGEYLEVRIGIHSGQCVAGVVGMKMPRYCLFGDTVNTASRMESTSESLKIHISETTYKLLENMGGYICEERGITKIKGKGEMRTYWLHAESGSNSRCMNSRERLELFHANDVTPDLICNAEMDLSAKFSNSFESFTRAAMTASNQSDLSKISSGDKIFPMRPYIRLPSRTCYCRTKYIYDRSSQGNVIAENFQGMESSDIFKISSKSHDIRHLCVCNLRVTSGGFPRGPRSAPHISFMQ